MQGPELFKTELCKLGFDAIISDGWVEFDYKVLGGSFNGTAVKMAIKVPPNFPVTPPGGIDFSPRLRPINTNAPHPHRSHESRRFRGQGEYWSRPFREWNKLKEKNTNAYMSHVRNLWITT